MSPALLQAITTATGHPPTGPPSPVSGGCIHRAWRLGKLFVKTNVAAMAPVFAAEADGLRAIAATGSLRVPQPVAAGTTEREAFLVLEWLDLRSNGDESLLGEQLAALHRTTSPRFGWHCDNHLGTTPKPNPPTDDWITFLGNHRLGHMLGLLANRGLRIPHADTLLARLDCFYPNGPPVPALLHGDLWRGNVAFLPDGTPVVFDPACWFGDPESDIAMSGLFGGFGPDFHRAYRAACGRSSVHPRLHDLHQLYHLLNHALLFGGHYLDHARSLTRSLAAD